mmetsp:Transcript_1049/g.1631  ORF Transcript_1049/g.1631 Transcript_1049/m.1631 type:complete len:100 (+) Transcript_1049:66-365(+)
MKRLAAVLLPVPVTAQEPRLPSGAISTSRWTPSDAPRAAPPRHCRQGAKVQISHASCPRNDQTVRLGHTHPSDPATARPKPVPLLLGGQCEGYFIGALV